MSSIQKVLVSKGGNCSDLIIFFIDISQCNVIMMSHKKVQQGICVHTERACHMVLGGFSTAFHFSSTPMFPAFHATFDAGGRMRLQKRIKTMQE